MRVEWCLAKARLDRWQEEIERIVMEMQCAVRYLDWHEHWWRDKVGARLDAPDDIRSGLDAYAHRQAAIRRDQALTFVNRWRTDLARFNFPDPWPWSSYPPHTSIIEPGPGFVGSVSIEQDDDGLDGHSDSSDEGSDDGYNYIRESSFFDTASEGSDWYSDGL